MIPTLLDLHNWLESGSDGQAFSIFIAAGQNHEGVDQDPNSEAT